MTSRDPAGSAGSSASWGQTSTTSGNAASYTPSAYTPANTFTPAETFSEPHVSTTPDAPTASVRPVEQSAPAGGNTHSAPSRSSRPARARGPRRASLQLRHVNPWTVLKFSCVLAIALFFVWLIVVGVLFGVLDAAGVIGKINDAYTTLKGDGANAPVTATLVFGSAAIIGVVNIILFIALSTVGSVIYNLCADLVGGIEVTLSER